MMITAVKEFVFDSAHFLPYHEGNCRNLHGHTYRLQVGVRGPVNPKTGMVVDFALIKWVVKHSIIDEMDHGYLNEIDFKNFPKENPTAENMVKWIRDVLLEELKVPAELCFIRLYETPTSYAEWRG